MKASTWVKQLEAKVPQHPVRVPVIDRFYEGAISTVEVEKFWGIGPES